MMSKKMLKQKFNLCTVAIVLSAVIMVSIICCSATIAAASLSNNPPPTGNNFELEYPIDPLFSQPTIDIKLDDPIDPLFSQPSVVGIVPPIGYIDVEDLQELNEQNYSPVEITCRVYNCPVHNHGVLP